MPLPWGESAVGGINQQQTLRTLPAGRVLDRGDFLGCQPVKGVHEPVEPAVDGRQTLIERSLLGGRAGRTAEAGQLRHRPGERGDVVVACPLGLVGEIDAADRCGREDPAVDLKSNSAAFRDDLLTAFSPYGRLLDERWEEATLADLDYAAAHYTDPQQDRPFLPRTIAGQTFTLTQAGDTLPLMCYRIYGEPKHYLSIARINNINNFRSLEPGINLQFPPIDKTGKKP